MEIQYTELKQLCHRRHWVKLVKNNIRRDHSIPLKALGKRRGAPLVVEGDTICDCPGAAVTVGVPIM